MTTQKYVLRVATEGFEQEMEADDYESAKEEATWLMEQIAEDAMDEEGEAFTTIGMLQIVEGAKVTKTIPISVSAVNDGECNFSVIFKE